MGIQDPAFEAKGRFYKGNLHGHSTRSDGVVDPEQVCSRYREAGYDFTCLTEHFLEIYGYPLVDTRPYRSDGFTTLIGAELHSGAMLNGELWHILAVGLPIDFQPPRAPHFRPVEGQESGPDIARRARDAGAFVVIPHPEWSALTLKDAMSIDAAHAVEIYNFASGVTSDRAAGAYMLDQMLSAGRQVSLCATDDSHFSSQDYFGGFTMVKAESNDPDQLVAALKAGHCYASNGPEIHDIVWEDRHVNVSCSPAKAVIVQGKGSASAVEFGDGLTEARIRLDRFDASPWMRVTVVDSREGRAWGQPYFREPIVKE